MRLASAAYGARSRGCVNAGCPTSQTLMRSRESNAQLQERGEVAEELARQVLRLVDDPQRRDLAGVDEFVHALLDVAPELRAAVARLQPQGTRQTAVDVDAAEVGLGLIEHQVAMRVQGTGDAAAFAHSGSGLAHAGLAGEQAESGRKAATS